jgi:hypothetical protein
MVLMVSILTSNAVDCGFEPRSGQTKDYKIGMCYFSSKHKTKRIRAKTGWLRISVQVERHIYLIHFTEFGAVMTTVLPVLFKYCYKYCYSDSRRLWAVMKGGGLAL